MDLGTKEHTSLSVCHCLGRRLGEGAVQQAAAVPLRRQGEGGAAGGQGPTACRLAPAAACLAACALRLAPEAGPEGRGRPLPSGVGRRAGGWRLGAGGWGGSADARGGVLACGRGGVGVGANRRKAGAHGQVETSSSMLGWASSKKLKKKIGPNPGPWPGWPGV